MRLLSVLAAGALIAAPAVVVAQTNISRTGVDSRESVTGGKVPLQEVTPHCLPRDCHAYTVIDDVMKPPAFVYDGRRVLPPGNTELMVSTLLCFPSLLKKDIHNLSSACINPNQPTPTQVLPIDNVTVKFDSDVYQLARGKAQRRLVECYSILWLADNPRISRESIPVELRFARIELTDANACR